MTAVYPTPDDHRTRAEELLSAAERGDLAPMNPTRVDMLSRATVHALLSLGAPAVNHYITVNSPGGAGGASSFGPAIDNDVAVAAVVDAVSTPEPSRTPPPQTPRKRAAKKTTSKETTK